MFIDGNGDAEGNFTVVALLDDQDVNGSIGMSMQPVGYFHYTPNGSNLPFALPVSTHTNYLRADILIVGGRQSQFCFVPLQIDKLLVRQLKREMFY